MVMATPGSARPPVAEATPEDIDKLLAPLGARERGFVLGLLLSRGTQAEREDTARVVTGPLGDRCTNAIRQANVLPRDGRLALIRRLAAEVLATGTEGPDVFAFADGRLERALEQESTPILRLLATPTSTPVDTLTLCAIHELERRPAAPLSFPPPAPSAPNRDDLIELRRALLAHLTHLTCPSSGGLT